MEKLRIEEWVEQGFSTRQIAYKYGCSQASVKYWLKKLGLKTQHQQHNKKTEYRCDCGETDPEKFISRGGDRLCKTVCRKCHHQRRVESYRDKKRQAVEYKGGCCEKCGYSACAGALHFHHQDPSKKDPNWRNVRSWSLNKIMEEIDGCQLLCGNCHAEIHWTLKGD